MQPQCYFFPVIAAALIACAGCGSDKKKSPPVNTAPTAEAASFTTSADTVLQGQLKGTDPDKDAIVYNLVNSPTQGTLLLKTNGEFSFTPASDSTGEESFSFSVYDGTAMSPPAIVKVAVVPLATNLSVYTRAAFAHTEDDEPAPLNSRTVAMDIEDDTAFDDILEKIFPR